MNRRRSGGMRALHTESNTDDLDYISLNNYEAL